jgi:hypothetical protein
MKTRSIVSIIFVAAMMSGCLVKSLHSFYDESDVVYKPELNGKWLDDDSSKWVISRYSFSKGWLKGDSLDNSYLVELYEDSIRPSKFNSHLFKVDGLWYLDFLPIKEKGEQELYDIHLVPAHSLARVRFDSNDRMAISWFNEEWLRKLFEENRVKISHEVIQSDEPGKGTQYILTASTGELKKFIVKYGNDPNAFSDEGNTNFLSMKLNRAR